MKANANISFIGGSRLASYASKNYFLSFFK